MFRSLLFNFTDRPGTPVIVERKVSGCNVTLKWTSPISKDCPTLFQTISYRRIGSPPDAIEWTVINITDVTVDQVTIMLNCTMTYEFQVRAWNELGGSDNSKRQSATIGVQSEFEQKITAQHPSGVDMKRAKISWSSLQIGISYAMN